MNRRSFLKILGVGVATVAAAPLITPTTAPLFVPSNRLDFGVPRTIVTATEMSPTAFFLDNPNTTLKSQGWPGYGWQIVPFPGQVVPMTLLWDEFGPPGWQQFGRQKVPAGTTLLVDATTAERWVHHNVAAPAASAPLSLQQESAKRLAEKRQKDARAAVEWEPWPSQEYAPSERHYAPPKDDPVLSMWTRFMAKAKSGGQALQFDDEFFTVTEGMA